MATFTPVLLSGSTNGKQIKVTGTNSGAAVTIHTATSSTTVFDIIHLRADNDSTSTKLLTIQFGGTTDVDNTIKVTIPARGTLTLDGLYPVLDGLPLNNSLVVKAFAETADVIKLTGIVHRYV
jgi:hypothetical protein